jgi:hypothetical protein
VTAFLFFYTRTPASLVSWTISQQAFNSSMILLLDALETGNLAYVRKVEQAYVVFRELQDNGVHRLAGLAVEKISWGLDQLRKNIGGHGAHQGSDRTNTACADKNEADRVAGASRDTVMGNTGMLLLEEAGLQSYTPERFTPLTWAMTGAESEATTPDQLNQEQELQLQGKSNHSARLKLDGSNQTDSITAELQGTKGSPQRSAFERYCAPLSQKHIQPHSRVTGPASPMSLAAPVPQHDHNDGTIVMEHRHSQQIQSPHPQHPDPSQITFTPFTKDRQQVYSLEGDIAVETSQQWSQPFSTLKQYQMSAAQFRHNSCPSLHQLETTLPLPRPTYSSPIAKKAQSPLRNERYDVHTQWLANPAVAISDSREPGVAISPMSDRGHIMPTFHTEASQQQQMMHQYSFSTDSTAANIDAIAVTNVEQMTVDQWKRWVGSGAHG